MTAINFPDSPSNGDTHTVGGVTYTYNSAETKWKTTINSNAFLPLTGGTVSGNIAMGGEIQHDGDTDTKIHFDTDIIKLDTAGSERFRVGSAGQLGIGGATYGTSGQVLTSQGSSAAPQWASVSGGLLQTKQTLLTATNSFSTSSTGAWFDIPNLTIDITTTAANSKIIINAFVFGEHTDQEPDKSFRVRRTIGSNTANISGVGTGSRPGVWNIMLPGWVSGSTGATGSGTPMNSYIDEPSQASGTTISYKVQVWSINSGSTFYLNRTVDDNNSGGYERGQSYISLMEVSV